MGRIVSHVNLSLAKISFRSGAPAILILSLLAIFCRASLAADDSTESFTLQNGLRVVVRRESFAPLAALQLWVETGSADENAEEIGAAHLLEHILFRGSAGSGAGKIAAQVEKLGGTINGFTSRDHTVYHMVLPAARAAGGLAALAELVQLPRLDKALLEKEAQVVQAEWKQGEDSPRAQLTNALFSMAYRVHPYGRSIIGTLENLHRITPEIVSGFYRRWYTAKNMILIATGDFSTDRLKEDIQRIFAALPAGAPPERRLPAEPPQDRVRLNVLIGPVTQSHLMIGFPIPAASDKESPALDLLAFILGRGESSRFAEKIKVSRGLVNSISASTFSTKDPGLFIVEAQVEANKLMDATAAILQEVYRLRRERVAPWELDRAHANFERALVRARETLDGQARQLGNFASVYRDADYAEVYLKNLRRVDAEDLRTVAQSFFKTEALSVALLVPEGTADVPDAGKIAALSRSLEPPAPMTQPQDGVLAATLDNGLRIVIEEDHRLPVVAVHAGVIGGLAVENERSNGIGNFIAQMLTQGTPQWSSPQLIRAVEEMGGTLSGWSGNSTVGLSGTFPSRHAETAMEIFLDALLHPAFPERELEKKRQEILLRIGNREERGRDRALRFFYQTLLVDHPYRLDPSGQREPVIRFRREDLVAQYQKLFSPERMVVSVAGDVEGENILRYLRTRLAPLRRSGAILDLPPAENGRRELRAAKRTSKTAQAQVVMGFQAPAKGAPGYFTMKVIEAILSRIGGRLFVDLRDQQGLAYSVGAFSLDDPLQGAFGVYAATDPANVERMKQEMLAALRRLREEEILPDELERAKNYLIGQYRIDRQTPAAKAADLADNELFGFGADYSKRYQEEIQKVSAVDILKFAYRYLPPDGYALAVVGP